MTGGSLADAAGARSHATPRSAGTERALHFGYLGPPSAVNKIGLFAVSAPPRSTQAWAVGDDAPFMACGDGYVLHYNGRSWSDVRAGLAANVGLSGVAAVSTKKIWIIGSAGKCTALKPYLAYSSGGVFRAWNLAWLGSADLNAISAASPKDIWVVGSVQIRHTVRPLALNWNGRSWRRMPTPPASGGLTFNSVSVSGPGNVWLLAHSSGGSTSEAIHWNGKHWSATYTFPSSIYLSDVATSSRTQAWLVGYVVNGPSGTFSAHWNGAKWTTVATPTLSVLLNAITMSGARTWAVGEIFANSTSSETLPEVLYSTGGRWKKEAAPDAGVSPSNQSAFFGVSAASSQFVVAVGQNGIMCSNGPGFADVYRSGTWHATSALVGLRAGLPRVPDCGG